MRIDELHVRRGLELLACGCDFSQFVNLGFGSLSRMIAVVQPGLFLHIGYPAVDYRVRAADDPSIVRIGLRVKIPVAEFLPVVESARL